MERRYNIIPRKDLPKDINFDSQYKWFIYSRIRWTKKEVMKLASGWCEAVRLSQAATDIKYTGYESKKAAEQALVLIAFQGGEEQ